MERSGGHVADIGFNYIIRLNLLKDFGINTHLPICTVLVAAGMNAENAELAHGKTEPKRGENGYRKDEN